ncbi:hypothetical protein C5S35_00740 [Candidatus Methanophagaceae archaeon]|nr:hypothetical protein C5S35_00740 [Methanophagales archaeon]
MNEIIIDTKGRIAVLLSIRKKWGHKEGMVVRFEERDEELVLKPEREINISLKDLCWLSSKRTGVPKWATPEVIKSIRV